jgi:hypothetical protein
VPYIYAKVDDLEGSDLVGTAQCAVLVEHYAKAPKTGQWTEGEAVRGNLTIVKGTAIATFVGGKYPGGNTGKHAAFYLSQNASGIRVMDQWANDPKKPKVSSRLLRFKGKTAGGAYVDPSNNGDAFSVIK